MSVRLFRQGQHQKKMGRKTCEDGSRGRDGYGQTSIVCSYALPFPLYRRAVMAAYCRAQLHITAADVLLHTRILEGAQLEDGTYSFASLFENITEEIQAADLAIVNQEVILGSKPFFPLSSAWFVA